MQILAVIENGLIKVYETDKKEKVVDGRELHEGLGNKRQFSDWMKQRLTEVDAVENEDYIRVSQNCETSTGGTVRIDYILKLNIAKEMAMLERNDKGKEYRRYFISVEEKYKQSVHNLSPELQAIIMHDRKIQLIESKVEKLENTMTIDYTQQEILRELANAIVIHHLGGKEAPAYKLAPKAFSEFWNLYKRIMAVNSYKNTAVKDYNKGVEVVKRWEPSQELKLLIHVTNKYAAEQVNLFSAKTFL